MIGMTAIEDAREVFANGTAQAAGFHQGDFFVNGIY